MKADSILHSAPSERATELHEQALLEIEAITDNQEQVFCIASGGEAYAFSAENPTEGNIFRAVKSMTTSVESAACLKAMLVELAQLAGSQFKEVSHD
jgi:hypothetical protein